MVSLPTFTRVKITKYFFTTFPKEKNQKAFPPVKQMCLAGTQYSNLSQRSQDKNSYLETPDTSIELITFSIFINRYKCLGADRQVGQKHFEEKFSVTRMFHLELVAEAADRNPTSKGNI